ncbi:hypothetical protein DCS_01915 [Drechmeria coniospora]|uniref:Saposin A-type domain-containing protein n=1 Tax=Drechmeria coniospora TaxID=98403 RepID=A0A151GUK1_DRECN|nr:hypothetical protein DCS_01915 [Drechmeria coniospora]KYK60777.1 hypothetical protein DCS_01915 [Drechmeria coniospora]
MLLVNVISLLLAGAAVAAPNGLMQPTENREDCDGHAEKKINDGPPGSNPCTRGPSYVCSSEDHMKKCGVTKEACDKMTHNKRDHGPPGSDRCTWGPDYWCSSAETMAECDVPVEYCEKLRHPPSA